MTELARLTGLRRLNLSAVSGLSGRALATLAGSTSLRASLLWLDLSYTRLPLQAQAAAPAAEAKAAAAAQSAAKGDSKSAPAASSVQEAALLNQADLLRLTALETLLLYHTVRDDHRALQLAESFVRRLR